MIDLYEEIEEDVCRICKSYVTEKFRGGNGWLCEGLYCEQVQEFYLINITEGIKYYRKKKLENIKKL